MAPEAKTHRSEPNKESDDKSVTSTLSNASSNATAAADAALEHVPVDIPAVAEDEPASDASTDLFADGSESDADLI